MDSFGHVGVFLLILLKIKDSMLRNPVYWILQYTALLRNVLHWINGLHVVSATGVRIYLRRNK